MHTKALIVLLTILNAFASVLGTETVPVETVWSRSDSTNIASKIEFSASGKYLGVGTQATNWLGMVRIYDSHTGQLVLQITNHPPVIDHWSPIPAFTFWGDTNLVSWNFTNRFSVYSIPDGAKLAEIILPMEPGDLNSQYVDEMTCAFSPSGNLAAIVARSSSEIYSVSLWNLRTTKLLHRFEGAFYQAQPVISRDEKFLGVRVPPLGYDCNPQSSFWNLETFQPITVPGFSDGTCLSPSMLPLFSPNNRLFLFPYGTIYELNTGAEHQSVESFFFTPDSKRVFGGSGFVSVKTGEVQLTFSNPPLAPWAYYRISPMGDVIAYYDFGLRGIVGVVKNPFANVRFDVSRTITGAIQLEWEGGSGKYRLESRTQLTADAWQPVLNETMETTYTLSPSESAQFFRLVGVAP